MDFRKNEDSMLHHEEKMKIPNEEKMKI